MYINFIFIFRQMFYKKVNKGKTVLSVILFAFAVLATFFQVVYKAEKQQEKILEVFLGYVFLFAVGAMSLIAAYMHLFVGEETAQNIGWVLGFLRTKNRDFS